MSSERVNVAMLGAGFIGQAHSVAFRDASLGRLDSRAVANFVALADRNLGLAADLAQRFGWQTCVSSWEELPETDVDLFVNAAPNDAHLVPSVGLAERGAFVFCEKPAGRDADEAFALWEGVPEQGSVTAVRSSSGQSPRCATHGISSRRGSWARSRRCGPKVCSTCGGQTASSAGGSVVSVRGLAASAIWAPTTSTPCAF